VPARPVIKKQKIMFKAFFDESGTDRSKRKAFVMAGFLGRVEEWERAIVAWKEGLCEEPRIHFFKHAEYQGRRGQFQGFTREQADRKILFFATIISRFDLHGFCSVAPHPMITDKPVQKGLLGTRIYDWAFAGITQAVLQHMAPLPPEEKVDFVFDHRNELRANIENFYEMKGWSMYAELMSHAGECTAGDDRQNTELQMADLLAAEFVRAGEQQVQSDAFKVIRDHNKIAYVKVEAPVQHPVVLNLMKFTSEIRERAGQFLKALKQGSMTPEETRDRLLDLQRQEALHNQLHQGLNLFLGNDAEYQEFRRKFQASTGIDPMNPTDKE
jgi:hypothetical protein